MSNLSAEIGRICLSKSGRDKGRYFLVKEMIDNEYVYIVDGMLRKLGKPKKKKIKHLDFKPEIVESIAKKFAEGQKVFDSEVRSAIYNSKYMSHLE